MSVQNVQSRKIIIANVIKNCASQNFFTTFTAKGESWNATRRLLVLDSSFNPPTKAHAKLLKTALESKPANYFDGSLLLFTTNNADKKLTGASVLQRLQMMELLACSFDSNIAVGLTLHGKFIDKAESIQSWFKHPVELTFILGYDTITRFFDPKYYPVPVKEALEPFFNKCRLICADRGLDTHHFWEGIGKEYGSVIDRIQLDPKTEAISSTKARLAIGNGDGNKETTHTLLDNNILQFILHEKIYM